MLDLSRRNMLLPISVNLCSLNFDHEVSIRTTPLSCILLREICCCLYQRICDVMTQTMKCTIEFAALYKCWKNCWMNPHVSCIICCILDRNVNRFSKEMFFAKETPPKLFFHSYNTSFLSCKYQHFCLLKTYQFLVIHECPSVFLKQFVSSLLDSDFLTGR